LVPLRPGGRPLVGEALNAAANVLKTKVVTNPDDRIGVVYYGVREKNTTQGFEGIRIFQELDPPSAQRIRLLEGEAERPRAQFEERYGAGHPTLLSDVFWACQNLFASRAPASQYHPRLFLFTCNDAPCRTEADKHAAITRAEDLKQGGVEVEFFPLAPAGGSFSINNFWGHVLPVDSEDYLAEVATKVEEIEHRIRRRIHRKRTLQRATLEITKGVEVALSVFVSLLEGKVPAPVYLHNESNKPLKSETRMICEQTGSILHKVDDIETFVELSGQRIEISRKEIDLAKQIGEPGMVLLGFKDVRFLKSHHRIFHSYFVYPDERTISGSAAICSALIQCMIEKERIAIVRYIARKTSVPVMAALVPQAECEDTNGTEPVSPPGFHMILLPWGEEIRDLRFPLPEGFVKAPPPVLADAARNAIQGMRLDDFVPGCVPNPVLQMHYAAVQALALSEEAPEQTSDMLLPDERTLNEKADLLHAWKCAIDDAVPGIAPGGPRAGCGGKRGSTDISGAADSATDAAPRLAKAARREMRAPITPEEMRELVMSGQVERLSVPELKDWLKSQNVSSSGKKPELVARVRCLA
jgi:ATP-dependent DNA helicase 2 subunit 1